MRLSDFERNFLPSNRSNSCPVLQSSLLYFLQIPYCRCSNRRFRSWALVLRLLMMLFKSLLLGSERCFRLGFTVMLVGLCQIAQATATFTQSERAQLATAGVLTVGFMDALMAMAVPFPIATVPECHCPNSYFCKCKPSTFGF